MSVVPLRSAPLPLRDVAGAIEVRAAVGKTEIEATAAVGAHRRRIAGQCVHESGATRWHDVAEVWEAG
jgi:hypothetical protein